MSAVLVQFLRVGLEVTMVFKGFVIRRFENWCFELLARRGRSECGLYPVLQEKFNAREVTRKLGDVEKMKIREDEIFSIDAVPFLYNYWSIFEFVQFLRS